MASPSTGDSRVRASLPFRPNVFEEALMMPSLEKNQVPRYLFRLHAPATGVKTTESNVIPPAWALGDADRPDDMFHLAREDAADILSHHLRWKMTLKLKERNLTSWTSSLLVALQHGLYRHATDFDDPPLDQIFLLILDTREFPKNTFIKDIEIAKFFRSFEDEAEEKNLRDLVELRERDGGLYYFGEYLSQGALDIDGVCAQTSLQSMVDLGLFQLHPDLGDTGEWNRWARRVVELRQPFRSSEATHDTTRTDVRRAITIAQGCFGDRWAVPVAAMLLALKPRKRDEETIMNGFAAMFTSAEIDALSLNGIKTYGHKLPEVKQFRALITAIYLRFGGQDIDLLAREFGDVNVV